MTDSPQRPCPNCGAKLESAPIMSGFVCMSCNQFFSYNYNRIIPGFYSIPETEVTCPICGFSLRLHPAGFFVCNNSACRTYASPQLLPYDTEVGL